MVVGTIVRCKTREKTDTNTILLIKINRIHNVSISRTQKWCFPPISHQSLTQDSESRRTNSSAGSVSSVEQVQTWLRTRTCKCANLRGRHVAPQNVGTVTQHHRRAGLERCAALLCFALGGLAAPRPTAPEKEREREREREGGFVPN